MRKLAVETVRILWEVSGGHTTERWPYDPRTLRCTYPLCTAETRHTAGACHDLYQPVCKRARGHHMPCHLWPEGWVRYDAMAKAAEELKEVFRMHQHLLTYEGKMDFRVGGEMEGRRG